jgi:prevent-host-death family protein
MKFFNIREARARLAEIVSLAAAGEQVCLTRHGKPAAVLVPPSAFFPPRADTAFKRRLHGKMKDPEFAAAFHEAKAEIAAFDAVALQNTKQTAKQQKK